MVRAGTNDTGQPALESAWNPGDDERKLCKIEMPQIASLGVRELISSPELGELAARVTGANAVQVWWVQLLHKPPSTPAEVGNTSIGWHRDRTYWGQWEEGSELFTAWVAISEVERDCGPMRFVKGSNRWPEGWGGDFWEQDLERQKASLSAPPGFHWQEEAAILHAGGVSFHDDLTLHGSSANLSGRPRRSFAIHMRTEKSAPKGGRREGHAKYLDDPAICPVIYGRLT